MFAHALKGPAWRIRSFGSALAVEAGIIAAAGSGGAQTSGDCQPIRQGSRNMCGREAFRTAKDGAGDSASSARGFRVG